MGSYLNPTSKSFQENLNSTIYSELIAKTNAVVNTLQKFVCVSCLRRFGKSNLYPDELRWLKRLYY